MIDVKVEQEYDEFTVNASQYLHRVASRQYVHAEMTMAGLQDLVMLECYKTQADDERRIRLHNPVVQKAYEQYRLLLELAR